MSIHEVSKNDYHSLHIDLLGYRLEFWRVRWDLVSLELMKFNEEFDPEEEKEADAR